VVYSFLAWAWRVDPLQQNELENIRSTTYCARYRRASQIANAHEPLTIPLIRYFLFFLIGGRLLYTGNRFRRFATAQ
jgi:hypothetical protein